MKIFRWKALIPLVLFVVVVVLAWTLYVDRLIRLGIEAGGTAAVGARVDLAGARLRLFQAQLRLRGLQVTNPSAPMTNLFQVGEIVVDINLRALLEKKFVAETMAVRDLEFGTPRRTSGALPPKQPAKQPAKQQGASSGSSIFQSAAAWASQVALPGLDLQGLGRPVNVAGLSPDSLRTIALARSLAGQGDSLTGAWERELAAADPRPVLDTARALATRLSGASLRSLGLAGARDAAASVRSTLSAVKASRDRLAALQRAASAQVDSFRGRLAALDRARADDYAYARRQVKLPSLDPKDVSAAMFGRMALERLVPELALLRTAQQRIPPGLLPQRQPGPKRARMAGTTFVFPKLHTYPKLLVEFAEGTFTLPGRTTMAGSYVGRLTGVTTEPAVYGRPLTFLVQRSGAIAGPHDMRLAGLLDHTGAVPRDSAMARLVGVRLPAADLGAVGARVDLSRGVLDLALARTGEQLRGRWAVGTDSAVWTRLGAGAAADTGAATRIGTQAWLNALVWRAVSSLRHVEIDAAISGTLSSPHLDVSSNVGGEVSRALVQALKGEVARAEAQVRAKVDSLVGQQVAAARSKLAALNTGPLKALAGDQEQLAAVQAQLEQRLKGLVPGIPGLRP
jgi:uncharacterized protein (TIGR03545 family)